MADGITLGIIFWVSILFTWYHLPQVIKDFFRNRPVLSDVTTGTVAFFLLTGISKSITAVVGSIVAGLLMNFTLTLDGWYKKQQLKK